MKKALIFFVMFLAVQAGLGTAIGAVFMMSSPDGNAEVTANQLIFSSLVINVVTIALFFLAHWCAVSRNYADTKPWAVLTWSALAAIGLGLPMTWLQEQMPALPNIIEDEMTKIMDSPWGYLSIAIMAPLVEELVFRGAILRALLQKFDRHWVAIAISAVFFSIAHFNPEQMPFAFLAGLLLGWMYCRTGSILPGMVYHWVNNSVAYITVQICPDPDMPLIEAFGGDETAMLLAVFFSLCIFVPSLFQLNLRMKMA